MEKEDSQLACGFMYLCRVYSPCVSQYRRWQATVDSVIKKIDHGVILFQNQEQTIE